MPILTQNQQSTFLGSLAICSGGGTLYHYGFAIKTVYEEESSDYPYSFDYPVELQHYNLGFAGSFLSMLAVVSYNDPCKTTCSAYLCEN